MSIENLLRDILDKLKYVKDYIVKLGPKRRLGSNFDGKILEAKTLYKKFKEVLNELPGTASNEIIILCTTIEECYFKIISFEEDKEFIDKDYSSSSKSEIVTMSGEKFCLKTAVSLLPKMTGDENVTQELIDAIDLYNSMLCDGDKSLLVNFVLKSRLSKSAKMRLADAYNSVDLLLKDMRQHLLSIKSDTALQSQLQKVRQGDRSVQDFGQEIEQLLVDLTISQANGNQAAYKILQPLNERNAVKCFANGLKSQRLGTIIAARNINNLKDAIRVAEDESGSVSIPQVFSYRHRGMRTNNVSYSSRGYRGRYSGNSCYQPTMSQQSRHVTRGTWRGRSSRGDRGGTAPSRGADAAYRGTPSTRYVRGNRYCSNYKHLNHFTENKDNKNDGNDDDTRNLGEFFRP